MKKLLTALILTACTVGAFAQAPAEPKKKGACMTEVDGKGLTGDARKKALQECRAAHKAQHDAKKQKHTACRDDVKAKGLKKADAAAAMKECMAK